MNQAAVPRKIEEISAQWLEEVLRGSLFNGRIESVRYEPVAGGYTGLNYRVFLTTRDQSRLSIFVKFPVGDSYNTKSAGDASRFQAIARREIRFYREIANEIQTPTPRCWFSAYDDDNSLLILEDLGSGRLPNSRGECSEYQLAQIAASMADFHRHFWQDPRLETMDWLETRFAARRDPDEETRSFQHAARVFGDRFKPYLSAGQLRVIDQLADKYPQLLSAAASPPFTLTHGDWTGVNLVWKEAEKKAYVIDWAGICIGSHVWDMIKFLDFELDAGVLDVFLHSYAESLNRDRMLAGFDDLCSRFYRAQAWYVGGTIEFIASIKEEHLRDPGTEWMWEFVNNREIFAHLAAKMI